jgi:hypothetical protein
MRAAQTSGQQMKQVELRVDAKHPPEKPPGRAIWKLQFTICLMERMSTRHLLKREKRWI